MSFCIWFRKFIATSRLQKPCGWGFLVLKVLSVKSGPLMLSVKKYSLLSKKASSVTTGCFRKGARGGGPSDCTWTGRVSVSSDDGQSGGQSWEGIATGVSDTGSKIWLNISLSVPPVPCAARKGRSVRSPLKSTREYFMPAQSRAAGTKPGDSFPCSLEQVRFQWGHLTCLPGHVPLLLNCHGDKLSNLNDLPQEKPISYPLEVQSSVSRKALRFFYLWFSPCWASWILSGPFPDRRREQVAMEGVWGWSQKCTQHYCLRCPCGDSVPRPHWQVKESAQEPWGGHTFWLTEHLGHVGPLPARHCRRTRILLCFSYRSNATALPQTQEESPWAHARNKIPVSICATLHSCNLKGHAVLPLSLPPRSFPPSLLSFPAFRLSNFLLKTFLDGLLG